MTATAAVVGAEPGSPERLIEVTVGRIGRPHGIRGEVTLEVRTDEPERRFAVGAQLHAEQTPATPTSATGTTAARFTVEQAKWHSGRLVARFREIDSRDAAEAARDTILMAWVAENEQPAEPDEYFDRQLVGLRAQNSDGVELGTVQRVLHLPSQDVLEIATPQGLRLVPFVSALVPLVDLPAGCLHIVELEGLLDASED